MEYIEILILSFNYLQFFIYVVSFTTILCQSGILVALAPTLALLALLPFNFIGILHPLHRKMYDMFLNHISERAKVKGKKILIIRSYLDRVWVLGVCSFWNSFTFMLKWFSSISILS